MTRALLAAVLLFLTSGCTIPEQIRWAFRDHPTRVQDEAIAVAWCESRHDPEAVSPGGHLGLFQLSPRWHSHRPGMDAWWVPVANAIAAEHLYDEELPAVTLAPVYADQLAVWSEHGIPDDRSTRDFALEVVLPKLWAAYIERGRLIDDLLATPAQCDGQAELDFDAPGVPLSTPDVGEIG